MKIYVCDRCKKRIGRISRCKIRAIRCGITWLDATLCDECYKAIADYIENYKSEVTEDEQ